MRHSFFTLALVLIAYAVQAQCTINGNCTTQPGTHGGAVTWWASHTYQTKNVDTATYSWQTVTLAPGQRYQLQMASTLRNYIIEVTACGGENISLGATTGYLSWYSFSQDLNNYSCSGYPDTTGEKALFTIYGTTVPSSTYNTYIYICAGDTSKLTDSATISYRFTPSQPQNATTGYNADNSWFGAVYKGLGTINTNYDYMGAYGTESAVFTRDFGTGQPGGLSAYMCPDSACNGGNDSFQIIYTKNIDLPQTYIRVTSNYTGAANFLSLPYPAPAVLTNSTDATFLYYPSYGNQWTLGFTKTTGSLKTDINVCQMAGDYTYGRNQFHAYVYSNGGSTTSGIVDANYQGTFTSDSIAFGYNWSGAAPTMDTGRCGKAATNSNYYTIQLLGLNQNALGSYKFRIRGTGTLSQFLYLPWGGSTWTTLESNVTLGDVTTSLINFTKDTAYLNLVFYKTTGSGALSFNMAKQPKNPGNMHATNDTVCFGNSTTLSIDTVDGTETQWYQNSCAGSGIYIGSGATLTVTPDSSTTYYARNHAHHAAPNDATNVLDLYTTACASLRIIVNPNPSAPSAPSSQSACSSSSHTFTFSSVTAGSGGNEIEWATNSSFSGSTVASSPANISVTVSVGVIDTVYIRSKVSATGCVSSAVTTTATNNATPSASASNSGPYCSYGTISLTGGASGLSSYSWSGPNSFTSTSQNPTRSASGNGGTYTIAVTGSNGCSASASTSVTVNVAPTATATNTGPYCSYGTISLTSGPNGMSSYSWAGPSSFSSTSQNPTRSASANGGNYSITVTDGNSCTASANTSLTVNTAPSAPAAPGSQNICGSSSHTFTFSSVAAGSGGDQAEWATNSSFSGSTDASSPANIGVTLSAGTTDTIYIRSKVSATGCVSSAVTTLAVNNANPSAPAAPVSIGVCNDSAYTFVFKNITSGGGGSNMIEWSLNNDFSDSTLISDGDSISLTINVNVIDVVWMRSISNSTGCVSNPVYTMARVNPFPEHIFNPSIQEIMEGDSANLNCPPGYRCYWYDINDTAAGRIIFPAQDTTYFNVRATNLAGCSSLDTTEIVVSHVPTISVINYKDTLRPLGDSTEIIVTSNLPNTAISWIRDNNLLIYGQDSGTGGVINIPLFNDTTSTIPVNFTIVGMHNGNSSNQVGTTVMMGANSPPDLTVTDSVSPFSSMITCSGDTLFLKLHFIDSVGPTYFGLLFTLGVLGGGTIDASNFTGLLPAGFGWDTTSNGQIFIYTKTSFSSSANGQLQLPFIISLACSTLPQLRAQQPWDIVLNPFVIDSILPGDSLPYGPISLGYSLENLNPIQFFAPNIITVDSDPLNNIHLTLNNDSSFSITYINNGTATYAGQLVFSAPFTNCGQSPSYGAIKIDSISVTIDSSNSAVYTHAFAVDSTPFAFDLASLGLSLPPNYTITFREYVKLVSCIPAPGMCSTGVSLEWGCPGNLCRSEYDSITAIQTDQPSVLIYRITPNNFSATPGYRILGNDFAWDSSCTGTGYTQWDFLVINTGSYTADNDTVFLNMLNEGPLFTYIFDPTYHSSSYPFPNPANFEHSFSGPDASLPIDTNINYLSMSAPLHCDSNILQQFGDTPIQNYTLALAHLGPAQNFILSFKTFRCCPDSADINFNTGVNFNHWKINATYDYCGTKNYINGYETNGEFVINSDTDTVFQAFSSPNGTGYISSNIGDGTPDLSLTQVVDQNFYPANLYGGIKGTCGLLPNGYCAQSSDSNCCGDPFEVHIGNSSFISNFYTQGYISDDFDSQLFSESGIDGPTGYTVTGTHPNGQFQVVIRPHGIKLVDDYDTVPIVITDGITVWKSSSKTFFCKNSSVYDDTIVAIFDIASLPSSDKASSGIFKSFFNKSFIRLYVQSCCPMEDSGGVDITTGYLTVETSFNPLPQLSCARCMIPLSRVITPGISLHCPGCITPGISSDFNLVRTNLGYVDSANLGAPKGGVLTRITPQNPTYASINKYGYIVGDSMQVTSNGKFLDGELDSIKFGFIQSHNIGVKITDFYCEEHFDEQLHDSGVNLQFDTGTLIITHYSSNYPIGSGTLQPNTLYLGISSPSDTDGLGGFLFQANLDSIITANFPLDSSTGIQPNDTFGFTGNYIICSNPSVPVGDGTFRHPSVSFQVDNKMYLTLFPLNVGWGFINKIYPTEIGITVGAAYTDNYDSYTPTGPDKYAMFYCDARNGMGTVYPIVSNSAEAWAGVGCVNTGSNDVFTISGGYIIAGGDPFPNEYRLLPGIEVDPLHPNDFLFSKLNLFEPSFNITVPSGFGMGFETGADNLWTSLSSGMQWEITNAGRISTNPAHSTLQWPAVRANGARVNFQCYADLDTIVYTFPSPHPPSNLNNKLLVVGDGWFQQGIDFQLFPICADTSHDTTVNTGDDNLIIPDYSTAYPGNSLAPNSDTLNPASNCTDCLSFPNKNSVNQDINPGQLTVTSQNINYSVNIQVTEVLDAFYFYYGSDWAQYQNNDISITSVSYRGKTYGFTAVPNTSPDGYYAAVVGEVYGGINSFTFNIHIGNCSGLDNGGTIELPIYYKWDCTGVVDTNNSDDSFPKSNHCGDTASFRLKLVYPSEGPKCTLSLGGKPSLDSASTCNGLPMQLCVQNIDQGPVGNLSFDMGLPDGFSIANMNSGDINLNYGSYSYQVRTTPPIISSQTTGIGSNLWKFDLTRFTSFGIGFDSLHIPSTGLNSQSSNFCVNFKINVPCQQVGVPILPPLIDTLSGQLYCGSTFGGVISNDSAYSLPGTFVWENGCGPYIYMYADSGTCTQFARYQVWGDAGKTTPPLSIEWGGGISDPANQTSVDTMNYRTMLPYAAGTYYVQVTDSNGCFATDSTISSSAGPPPTAYAGPNDSICANGTYTLSFATANNYNNLKWSSGAGGSLSNDTALNPVFNSSGIPSGNVTLQLIAFGNLSCGNDTSIMVLTIKPTVTPAVSITSNHSSRICSGTSVTFTATPTNGGSGVNYQWLKNGINISSDTSSTYTTSSLRNNDYISCEIMSNAICASPRMAISDSIRYSVDSIVLNLAGTTDTICLNTSYGIINITPSGGYLPFHYNWANGDSTANLSNLAPGNYAISVTDSLGCVKKDTITINADSSCCPMSSGYSFGSITATNVFNILSHPFNNEIGSKTIAFNGTFTVDVPTKIYYSNLYFGPGAGISIDSGVELEIFFSSLTSAPCDSILWKGIKVNGTARLIFGDDIISNAQYAVEAFNNSILSIESNDFENNFIGFYFDGIDAIIKGDDNIKLNMPNPLLGNVFNGGQLYAPYKGMANSVTQPPDSISKWSWAGVQVDFLPSLNVGVLNLPPNYFSGLADGIISFGGSLNVINSIFSDIFSYGYNNGSIYGSNLYVFNSSNSTNKFEGNGILLNGAFHLGCNVGGPCPAPLYSKLYERGLGKYETTNPTFLNCTRAISALNVDVDIADNRIINKLDSSAAGIRVAYGLGSTIKINNNWLTTQTRGIQLLNNDPAYLDSITNNLIDISSSVDTGIGLEIYEMGNAPYAKGASSISNNTINVDTGALIGMLVTGTNGLVVNNDTVNLNYVQGNLAGIKYAGCKNLYDYQNIVSGNASYIAANSTYPHCPVGIYYYSTSGLATDTSVYTVHKCNTVKNLHIGIQFTGVNLLTAFTSNNFNDPVSGAGTLDTALLVDTFTTIPGQTDQSNKWWGTSSGQYKIAGMNLSALWPFEIFYHSLDYPYDPNKFSVALPSLWFQVAGNDTDKCSEPTVGQPDTGAYHLVEWQLIKELDSILLAGKPWHELMWQNYLIILGRLHHNPVVDDTDAFTQIFVGREDTSSLGHLLGIGDSLRSTMQPSSGVLTQMKFLQDTIGVLQGGIRIADSAIATLMDSTLMSVGFYQRVASGIDTNGMPVYNTIYDSLMNEIVGLHGFIHDTLTLGYLDSVKAVLNNALVIQIHTLDSLLQASSATRHLQIQSLSNTNTLIQTTMDVDSQYKQINDIYFNSTALDSTSFTSTQLTALNQLAFECPLVGGDAVFKARALLAMVEDNIYFDDVLCAEPDLKMARVKKDTTPQSLSIKLYPNPANDYVMLQFTGTNNEQLQLKISDGLGNVVLNKPVSTTNGLYTINTSSFSEGMYYVSLYDNSDKIFGEKLCIFMR